MGQSPDRCRSPYRLCFKAARKYLLSSIDPWDPFCLPSSCPCPKIFWVAFGNPRCPPLLEISKGSSQAGNQGQGAEGEKGKDKDKGKKPSTKAKDAAKVKEVEAGTQEVDPKAKDAPSSQPSQKEDPPAKA